MVCSIRVDAFPSIGILANAVASAQYPRIVNKPIVKGSKANRTPASFREYTKADTNAYSISMGAKFWCNGRLTVMIVLADHIRYPSLSPKPVLIESISLFAREMISPGPTRSKNA
jgi:hypothetical protein